MLRPRRKITFETSAGNLIFDYVLDCVITSGFNIYTDKATIVLPRTLSLQQKEAINKTVRTETLFEIGDKVTYTLGYDIGNTTTNLTTRFQGFITRLDPDDNLIIYCEDEMWFCKQDNKQVEYPQITTKNLVTQMTSKVRTEFSGQGFLDGEPFTISAIDSTVSGYRLKRNPTIAQALEGLRKNFGFRSWFRDHVLYVGLLWIEDQAVETTFTFQKDIIKSKLEYRKAEDFKIGISMVSINEKDNSRLTEIVGEEGGDLKTLHYFHRDNESNAVVRARLIRQGEIELASRNYTGYYGTFTTFADPPVKHGDNARIKDHRYPERDGIYKVESVKTMDGTKGSFQEIRLNSRIDV